MPTRKLLDARILIVDDQQANVSLLEGLLKKEGYSNLLSLIDSRKVVKTFREWDPDLILLDLMMPHMDGFAVMEQLRSVIPADAYLPILVLTADITPGAKQRALSGGAKDFLTKPFDAVEVVLRIRNLLQTRFLHLQLQNQNAILDEKVRERTAELERTHHKLASILNSAGEGIYGVDLEGRTTFINPAALQMLGYSQEEMLGQLQHALIHHTRPDGSLYPREECPIYAAFMDAKVHRLDNEVFWRKDGSSFFVEYTSTPLWEGNEIVGAVVTFNDITARKQAEEGLRQRELEFRSLAENIPDIVARFDQRLRHVYINEVIEKITGIPAESFIGKTNQDLSMPASKVELWDNKLRQVFDSAQAVTLEFDFSSPTGLRHLESRLVPELGPTGRVEKVLSVVRDITERKRAEKQIQRQLKHLNALRLIDTAISSSFDLNVTLVIVLQQVISQLDVDASAVLLFDPYLQTLEYAASQGFYSTALHHTRLKLGEGYASRVMQERKTIHITGLVENRDSLAPYLEGESFVNYYGTPLIFKGEVKGVLEIYHRSAHRFNPELLDFLETLAGQAAIAIDNAQLFENLQRAKADLEQRVIERTAELYRSNVELEHANRAKDAFLANMSHELRTPLNSILGLSETLLEQRRDPLSEYQQKSLRIIESSGSHLLELINDILDLSKIEAGKFDYQPQIIGVDELCHSSLAFVMEQALRKSITLNYHNQQAVSKVYADPRRLKQILVNLLTNAVKFTPNNGQVILQVQSDVEQDRLQFSVIDTGIGIAPEDLERLFQPFVQVDNRLTREYEGTGLGLALVQKLTDLQGGSVDVESTVGKGSRFTINLPTGQAMLEQQTVNEADGRLPINEQLERSSIPAAGPADRGIILLAEDNAANILTIGDYLESRGYQVVVTHDGVDAILKAQELQPNIILMDIQMPALDGLEAIRRLRADQRFASTPIIALTALAMPGDRERCLEAGANEYLSKPVSLKGLVKTIHVLLGNSTGN